MSVSQWGGNLTATSATQIVGFLRPHWIIFTSKTKKTMLQPLLKPHHCLFVYTTFFFYEIFRLHTGLCSNLCSKVVMSLLDTFAGLKTNETFNSDLSAVSFSNLLYVFCNILFSIFCFYINLIQQADRSLSAVC